MQAIEPKQTILCSVDRHGVREYCIHTLPSKYIPPRTEKFPLGIVRIQYYHQYYHQHYHQYYHQHSLFLPKKYHRPGKISTSRWAQE